MQQSAYVEYLIYGPQCCLDNDPPPKRRYTEMHAADWWWETQVNRNTRG